MRDKYIYNSCNDGFCNNGCCNNECYSKTQHVGVNSVFALQVQ